MNDNLLSNDPTTAPEPKSYIEALTAPGGKFDKTKYSSEQDMYEAIAKGKWHADNALTVKERAFDDLSADYIKQREMTNSQASLQDLIDQLKNAPTTPNTHTQPGTEVQQPSLDPKELESLIDNRIGSYERQHRENANFAVAKKKLTERFGDNYSQAITSQLEELGMSEAEFNQMARSNPKLFERTFIPSQQTENFQSPPRSTNRLSQPEIKRTWAYYQQLKKDSPRVYSDPKTQLQLMKDYETLGKDFEDGDFHRI